jgi:hypothetical protein
VTPTVVGRINERSQCSEAGIERHRPLLAQSEAPRTGAFDPLLSLATVRFPGVPRLPTWDTYTRHSGHDQMEKMMASFAIPQDLVNRSSVRGRVRCDAPSSLCSLWRALHRKPSKLSFADRTPSVQGH